jgi:hypothetical protein
VATGIEIDGVDPPLLTTGDIAVTAVTPPPPPPVTRQIFVARLNAPEAQLASATITGEPNDGPDDAFALAANIKDMATHKAIIAFFIFIFPFMKSSQKSPGKYRSLRHNDRQELLVVNYYRGIKRAPARGRRLDHKAHVGRIDHV